MLEESRQQERTSQRELAGLLLDSQERDAKYALQLERALNIQRNGLEMQLERHCQLPSPPL